MNFTFDQLMILYLIFLAMCILWKFWYNYLVMHILYKVCTTSCTFCDGISCDVYSLECLYDSLYNCVE